MSQDYANKTELVFSNSMVGMTSRFTLASENAKSRADGHRRERIRIGYAFWGQAAITAIVAALKVLSRFVQKRYTGERWSLA